MQLLDGKKQQKILSEIAAEVQKMKDKEESTPFSSSIVGNDGASLTIWE
jgi:5,10-methylene-tetrahydrofolate dehydrogenase/methenyl tetrahydrofolate cyclohydrolase